MTESGDYYWVIADYNGQEDDTDFLPVANGEVVRVIQKGAVYYLVEKDDEQVRVIQKGAVYYLVEKDDEQGKVPFECLRSCAVEQSPSPIISDTTQNPISKQDEFFWVIADYNGQEDDDDFLPVAKGELVRVIKKEAQWFYIEKDGEIGKIPQQF
ncbi:MAG: hypothetical protein EZS28_021695, partial [Streblomastix strix]